MMPIRNYCFAIVLILLSLTGRLGMAGTDLSAEEISRRASEVDKVQDWSAQAHIEIKYADGTVRNRDGEIENRLKDGRFDEAMRLYRFDSPVDIAGTSLLIHENGEGDDDLWLYLPSLSKSRRIVSGDKKNRFVGTEFAYVDLMTQKVEDYDYFEVGQEPVGDAQCYVIESIPKTPKIADDIGYSKLLSWIRIDNFTTLRVDYYDRKNELFKTQRISDLQPAGNESGKWIAGKRQMKNLQSKQETEIAFEGITVNSEIPARTFSPSRLGRH